MLYIHFKENTNDIELVSGAKRLTKIKEEKEKKLTLALSGNDLCENQFILSEIFLTEYNDEIALNPINILVPSCDRHQEFDLKRKNSWPQVAYSLVGEINKQGVLSAMTEEAECYIWDYTGSS